MLQALLGLPVLLTLGWLLSTNRQAVRWRPVVVGVILQWVLALLVLKTGPGQAFFDGAQGFFLALIEFAKEAGRDVFGVEAIGLPGEAGVLAALVIISVVFFASVFAVLHHLGVVRIVVGAMAKAMSKTMGTSGAESTSAAANIFVGQTEAPLLVRPYVAKMTPSEIGAIMTVGFATVAGGVFGVYVTMLEGAVPGIGGHLLAASVMSAPMALGIAKLVFPETGTPETLGSDASQPPSSHLNLVDAAAGGASDGMKMSLNILGMLIAFLGLLALLNGILDWTVTPLFQRWEMLRPDEAITLQGILGWLASPIAWLLGVPWNEAQAVGSLLGTKVAVNEYVAFKELAGMEGISEHSRVVTSYALCGFANFSSIAIQIGGLGGICPERRGEFARLGLRAMIGGALASFITAATASVVLGF